MSEFHETVTLVAALEGDGDTVRDRVLDMLRGERAALAAACDLILDAVADAGDAGDDDDAMIECSHHWVDTGTNLLCEICGDEAS